VAVGNLDDEGRTCTVEMLCTRELGDPFRRDACSEPVRLLEKYKDYVCYASQLSPE
jgi:sulfoacetaldehyde acetyltransferase